MLIFDNGLIEQNENLIEIRGPAMNLNKNNFFLRPKLLEKFEIDESNDTKLSLEKSLEYFLKKVKIQEKFCKTDNLKILNLNKLLV